MAHLSCWPYGLRENLLKFFYYESIGANGPRGVAILDPRTIVGSVYIGLKHKVLQHAKYIRCEPHDFRVDFKKKSHDKSRGGKDHHCM